VITTSRNQYIAAHVSETVKKSLQVEANRQKSSVSALIAKILAKELRLLGYEVKE
jgi:hypothetical protein